jgi:MerR family transcriptional regulator, light-induced transcriptional regulator
MRSAHAIRRQRHHRAKLRLKYTENMAPAARSVLLREAADLLGVHYQTAYGWVRQGLLPATKTGHKYQVRVADVNALGARRTAGAPPGPELRVRSWQLQSDQFYDAIVAGAERLAQTRLERLAVGVPFIELCERIVVPALRRIGDDWAAGDVPIAVEHRASAICERLLGPLVARRRRGRPRGLAVTATPPGERHALPALMASGALREDHWLVQHLATDLPANEVGGLVRDVAARLVVLSAATDEGAKRGAKEAVQLAEASPGLLVLAGRPGDSLYDLRALTRMLASDRGRAR